MLWFKRSAPVHEKSRAAGADLTSSRVRALAVSAGKVRHLPLDGEAEDLLEVLTRELVDVEEVTASPGRSRGADRHPTGTSAARPMTTSSVPSVSSRRTWTTSSAAVGRFLPTKSGRIGSSRWPRSTTTARRTARGRP